MGNTCKFNESNNQNEVSISRDFAKEIKDNNNYAEVSSNLQNSASTFDKQLDPEIK